MKTVVGILTKNGEDGIQMFTWITQCNDRTLTRQAVLSLNAAFPTYCVSLDKLLTSLNLTIPFCKIYAMVPALLSL